MMVAPRICLWHGDCRGLTWPIADLVVGDPPWTYAQQFSGSHASDHYPCLSTKLIADFLDQLPGHRLALWMTFPLLDEWTRRTSQWTWGSIRSAGTWVKSLPEDRGHYGPGYHWAGCAECVLLYTRGAAYNNRSKLRNAWVARPTEHSVKPVDWMTQWVQRWVPNGGMVTDPFAGFGSVAMAVKQAGGRRRYMGAEIQAQVHARAVQRIRHSC